MSRGSSPPDELATFIELHYDRLASALVLHCGDPRLAEELAQEAIVRVCEHWEDVRSMQRPVGWMFRTAFNLSSSSFRRRQAAERAYARAGHPASTTEHVDDVDALVVREAMRHLPKRQRSVLILRYFLGYTPQEVADMLGMTNAGVRSTTHRALKKLAARPELAKEALVEEGANNAA